MWAELDRALRAGAVIAYGAGLSGAWAGWLAAQLAQQQLVIVVARDDAHASELESDLRFFWGGERDAPPRPEGARKIDALRGALDPIASLPGIDGSPYADLAPERSCIVERVATLYRLT